MKPFHNSILLLSLLTILIYGIGYILVSVVLLNVSYSEIVILSTLFSVISILTILIFFRGQGKEPDSQTMHSLVSISLKFLLELGIAYIWFIVAKKTSLPSVLMFFVLYLTFTLFSVLVILRTLKNKSL